MKFHYLKPHQGTTVHAWWRALDPNGRSPAAFPEDSETTGHRFPHFDRGHRARLRRAVTLSDLQGESSVYALREHLGEMNSASLERDDQTWLFLLAGSVALVKSDATLESPEGKLDSHAGQSLGARLGKAAAAPGEPAPMSELRFKRLLRADTPENFFQQLRRALRMVGGSVDVAVLADDLLGWCVERSRPRQTAKAMHYRWARDYFLSRKDRNDAVHQDVPIPSTPIHTQEPLA